MSRSGRGKLSSCRRRHWAGAAAGFLLLVPLSGCGSAEEPAIATAASPGSAATVTTTRAAEDGAAGELGAYLEAQRKWVACLREQGFDVPDPDAKGNVDFSGLPTKTDKKLVQAQEACSSLSVSVPESVQKLNAPRLTEAQIAINERYAECMQESGAPDFPDPGPDGYFPEVQWDQTSAGAQRASDACASIIGDKPSSGNGVG